MAVGLGPGLGLGLGLEIGTETGSGLVFLSPSPPRNKAQAAEFPQMKKRVEAKGTGNLCDTASSLLHHVGTVQLMLGVNAGWRDVGRSGGSVFF